MKRQSKPATKIRVRLILGAIFVAAFITACPNPDQLMDARINDFLDDLSRITGEDSSDDSRASQIVDRHLHPEARNADQVRTASYWNDAFNAENATAFSWTLGSSGDDAALGGTVRRTGTVRGTLSSGDVDTRSGVSFYMKESGSNWLIRGIRESGASNFLLENIR